jgi:hypothetical protein
VCTCNVIHRVRMGMGAMVMISTDKWDPQKDLPHYEYQKIRFAHFNPGKTLWLFRQVVEIYQ